MKMQGKGNKIFIWKMYIASMLSKLFFFIEILFRLTVKKIEIEIESSVCSRILFCRNHAKCADAASANSNSKTTQFRKTTQTVCYELNVKVVRTQAHISISQCFNCYMALVCYSRLQHCCVSPKWSVYANTHAQQHLHNQTDKQTALVYIVKCATDANSIRSARVSFLVHFDLSILTKWINRALQQVAVHFNFIKFHRGFFYFIAYSIDFSIIGREEQRKIVEK